MSERKPLSKRTRFEVFKRDRFTCAYCGRTPPAVILHVDHIISVSEGGSDDIGNLVTSCFDCNSGKSNVPLTQVPRPILEGMESRKESLEQLQALRQLMIEEREAEDAMVMLVSDAWMRAVGNDPAEMMVTEEAEKTIRFFLKKLSIQKLIGAAEGLGRLSTRSGYQHVKYFAGTCWGIIRDEEAERSAS